PSEFRSCEQRAQSHGERTNGRHFRSGQARRFTRDRFNQGSTGPPSLAPSPTSAEFSGGGRPDNSSRLAEHLSLARGRGFAGINDQVVIGGKRKHVRVRWAGQV